jgi:uncharacterized membrane protein YdbT with pleckstrin-like domain
MGYIEENLAPGERVVYKTGCHWIVLLWPLVAGLVLGFAGLALFAGGWLATRNGARYHGAMVEGAILLIAAAALITGGVILRLATDVAVSNQRVLIRTGLFSRRNVAVLLPRVESIGMKETLPGRILGYGTLVVRGTGGSCEKFEKVREPNELRRQIQGQLSGGALSG